MLSRAFRFARNFTLYHKPWPLSEVVAERLDGTNLLEEEHAPYYDAHTFHNTRLGDILNGRYQIATKLGYGTYSTVWLARDLRRPWFLKDKYLTVKIGATFGKGPRDITESESNVLRHISKPRSRHEGWLRVRKLVDSFQMKSLNDKQHHCLVFEPLLETLDLFKERFSGRFPKVVIKILAHQILLGLDYLHAECNVIHGDIKPDNIMVNLKDLSKLDEDAKDEFKEPLPQKHTEDGRRPGRSHSTGLIQITDFGYSKHCKGDEKFFGCIQANTYRAPEVILDVGYSYPVDIWTLGVMLWEFVEGKGPFRDTLSEDYHDESLHLAQLTALLGPVPAEFAKGRRYRPFYDETGQLKTGTAIPEDFTFENKITSLEGDEKTRFINFIRRMMTWRPEDRATAKELLKDPWVDINDL